MNLSDLIVLLVLRINSVFELGYSKKDSEAEKLFSHVLSVLMHLRGLKPSWFSYSFAPFTVFISPLARDSVQRPNTDEIAGDIAKFSGTLAARSIFEKKWVKFIKLHVNLKTKKCISDEKTAIVQIYLFFKCASLEYEEAVNETIHLFHCKSLSDHSRKAVDNFNFICEELQNQKQIVPLYKQLRIDAVADFKKNGGFMEMIIFKSEVGCPLFKKCK